MKIVKSVFPGLLDLVIFNYLLIDIFPPSFSTQLTSVSISLNSKYTFIERNYSPLFPDEKTN